MSTLWNKKTNYIRFDPKQHHINDTCGSRYVHFIPYERLYSSLDEFELLDLIHDAKSLRWQALDLSCCALKYLPDELWDLPDLKMLYLGNRLYERNIDGREPSSQYKNIFPLLPQK